MNKKFAIAAVVCLGMLVGAAPSVSATPASVSLYVSTDRNDSCEKSNHPSGDYVIRNNEGVRVHVVINRFFTQGVNTTHDQVPLDLAPHETRALGCSSWWGGSQALSVSSASY